jgi:cell division control protein 12
MFAIACILSRLTQNISIVRLTVIDTPGFGDYVNNRDSWMPVIEFLDDQHESYMLQEQQPRRGEKIDLRVHACLYFIRPTGHTLKPLDIEVMKRLSSRVNLIPVVAKADTLSPADLARFKNRIRDVIDAQGIKIYQPPVEEDDETAASHARSLMSVMPFSVIGSEKDVKTADGRIVKGRQYSWGVAEVENEDHCDFKKLRVILVRTHMLDLIHTTEEMHYEAYRAQQMETRKFGEARPRRLDNPKFKEEEENLRKRFTEQVKVEEQRFRTWEQKLIGERDRLNKDLEGTHAAYVILLLSQAMLFTDNVSTQYHSTQAGTRADARLRRPQPRTPIDDPRRATKHAQHFPTIFTTTVEMSGAMVYYIASRASSHKQHVLSPLLLFFLFFSFLFQSRARMGEVKTERNQMRDTLIPELFSSSQPIV